MTRSLAPLASADADSSDHRSAPGLLLIGDDTDNRLVGGKHQDTLDGGTGADTLVGGAGGDLYIVDSASDVIEEANGGGYDIVKASVNWTLQGKLAKLVLTGNDDLSGTGNGLDNKLTGNQGNNWLDGGSGADLMSGGLGNDSYVVDNLADIVNDYAGEGTDTVLSAVNWSLGLATENLTLTGKLNLWGDGNQLSNVLTGNTGNNTLMGHEGNDTLNGKQGVDTMWGGTGNDVYFIDSSEDSIIEDKDAGKDTVKSELSWTLQANFEDLVLLGSSNLNATGNSANNLLVGNSGDNILDDSAGGNKNTLEGGAGNDTLIANGGDDLLDGGTGIDDMRGGSGDDVYVVDDTADQVTETSLYDHDVVQSHASWSMSDNLEQLTLMGSAAIDGTGNKLSNLIEGNVADNRLYGGDGDDHLTGGKGNDTLSGDGGHDELAGGAGDDELTGGSGNDTLEGYTGVDIMRGGAGDDLYKVDSAADVLIEAANEGFDAIVSSVSWTLSAGFEKVQLEEGIQDLFLTGNVEANFLTGNDGQNLLTGLGGRDTIRGRDGDDTIIIDDGAFAELDGGAGFDTVQVTGGSKLIDLVAGSARNNWAFKVSHEVGALEEIDIGGSGNNTLFIDPRVGSYLASESEVRGSRLISDGWTSGTYNLETLNSVSSVIISGDAGDKFLRDSLDTLTLLGFVSRDGNEYDVYKFSGSFLAQGPKGKTWTTFSVNLLVDADIAIEVKSTTPASFQTHTPDSFHSPNSFMDEVTFHSATGADWLF